MTIYVAKPDDLPDRHDFDFYSTPHEVVEKALLFIKSHQSILPNGMALDWGSGDGVWGQGARHIWPNLHITGVEVRDIPMPEGYDNILNVDLRSVPEQVEQFNLIMGNPPYKYADEVVRRSLKWVKPNGAIVLLLRLAYLAGQRRQKWLYSVSPPTDVVILSRRPGFYVGEKRTNATDFALFCWVLGGHRPANPRVHFMMHENKWEWSWNE